eukprot:GHRQ01032193.1.p1 GENE.GHRQ01032193.1~~GHRQ01032193.1.p1  ORF type:complete len:127 (-),score=30.55 GHRQ01032193.1:415-738(-)
MEPLVAMLKIKLGAFGWAEAVRRDQSGQWRGHGAASAVAELDEYLERMGVRWGAQSVWLAQRHMLQGRPTLGRPLQSRALRAPPACWSSASFPSLSHVVLARQQCHE